MSSNNRKFFTSSIVMIATSLTERGLGLISTLIIARILTPEDFGIVAIAMIAVMFFDMMSKTGGQEYIIQKTNVSNSDVNTAWTLNFVLKCILFFFIVLFSSNIAKFYEDPRLAFVLIATSFSAPVLALCNPGLFLEIKHQKYYNQAKMTIIRKIVSLLTTITIAIVYQSYWALVIGQLSGAVVYSLCSYVFIKYRPKLSFNSIAKQWAFSKWMLLKGVLGFLRAQSDMIIVGKFFDSKTMGGYHLSKYISTMPTTEILQPALAPLLASLSRVKNDRYALIYQIEVVILVISIAVVPISFFIYSFSDEIVRLILGSQWLSFNSIFGLLALSAISVQILGIPSIVLTSLAKLRVLFVYDFVSFLFVIMVLFNFRNAELEIFVLAKVVSEFVAAIFLFFFVGYHLGVTSKFLILILTFIVNGAVSIAASQLAIFLLPTFESNLLNIIFLGFVYVSIYSGVLLLFYSAGARKIPQVVSVKKMIFEICSLSKFKIRK